MRSGKRTDFAPNGTDVGITATVKAAFFIENAATHGIALHIVIVTVYERILFFKLVFAQICVSSGIFFLEVLADL